MTAAELGGAVLLHGLGRTAGSMRPIERALRAANVATLRLNYPARRRSLIDIADFLRPRIEAFAGEIDGPLHFVTHSLGGLVVRAYIARTRPPRLGRVVMLAPPNQGSPFADRLMAVRFDRVMLGPVGRHLGTRRSADEEAVLGIVDYPLGIIAGNRALDPLFPRLLLPRPNDGKVSVEATKIAGMAAHIVLPVSHTFMTANRSVIGQTVAFIRDGSFDL